ncbi:MAG: lysine--tRNA ligase [Minisyncoccia bacterium]|jgi:lysyl-tRNA synthetase class 1
MFWADRLAKEITEHYRPSGAKSIVIRDEKTLSGRVHMGSIRGAAIHGAIHEALDEAHVSNIFIWEHNDFDVFDSVPFYLSKEKFEPYLGMLLRDVPSPDGVGNYAEYYGKEFQEAIEHAGWHPEFYWGSEPYVSGAMDTVIREALEGADAIRRIQKEVSGSERKKGWLPISVICPQCKKVATTNATDFNGTTVQVDCHETKVPYTKGCGFSGRVSPFGGNAKLFWKAEWPAKWKVHDVKVEGGGKDHSTKGGSRDVANHIAKEIFKYEPPFDVPYEFFLVGGKKMSSSKGRGSSAKEIANLLPAKILRLALLGKDINQAINFDPEGDTIPTLYDQYDKLAERYQTTKDDDYARLFELIHPERVLPPPGTFFPRFSQVAFLVQMPHLNLEREVAALKGGELSDADKQEFAERAAYAKKWLAEYAPEKFVFTLQKALPEAAQHLSDVQKKALGELKEYLQTSKEMRSGEEIQQKLYHIKELLAITPQDLFGALYLSFLGKSYGPKIGWFLSVLDKDFVLKRLQEAIA